MSPCDKLKFPPQPLSILSSREKWQEDQELKIIFSYTARSRLARPARKIKKRFFFLSNCQGLALGSAGAGEEDWEPEASRIWKPVLLSESVRTRLKHPRMQ